MYYIKTNYFISYVIWSERALPIYEYECQNCGNFVEALQGFNEEPLKTCDMCNEDTLKLLISLSSFHLKGNGWYKSDYAKKPSTPMDKNKKKKDEKPDPQKTHSDIVKDTNAAMNKSSN